MWDFLSLPGFETQAVIAAWTTAVAFVSTAVLVAYTLALRRATVVGGRRRRRVIDRWRRIFAAAMLSESEACCSELPRFSRRERTDLLEEWNGARVSVEGDAVAHLIVLAERLRLHSLARAMFARRKLSTRLLAIQTLGHMRSAAEWDAFVALLDHPNTALSVTAAEALVDINARDAVPLTMSRVIERDDWPQTTVARMLKVAGPALITLPLCNAILTADVSTAVRLLRFAGLIRGETLEQLVEVIVREREEPAVLSAAMNAAGDHGGVPRMDMLAKHETWYVRMQAAKLLGRVGQQRDLPMLERLLGDREWWVRYRAAQSIVSLPFMGPGALKALRGRQTDPYAADMMRQAMAEAGLE